MIIRLTGEVAPELLHIGGKGAGLVRLIRHGFAVPEAWCLPAPVFAGAQGRVTPAIEQALREFWSEFRGAYPRGALAVRSSATAEDLEGASFAGVYQTTLGVESSAALVAAVAGCFASLQSDAAAAYRKARGLGGDVSLAVLLQRLVPADVAGVLLTANPRRPFAAELAIDAAYGLGEAVVSGRTQPDHIVLHRETLALREQLLGEKKIAAVYSPGRGVRDRAVPAARRRRLCLSPAQLATLGQFARQVGRRLGPRLDVEWAFEGELLYLLQQRPITGLPPENPRDILSRKFADEFVTEYVVPFSHIFVDWINGPNFMEVAGFIGRKDLAAIAPVRLHNGYTYISGRWLAEYLTAYPRFFRAPGRVVPDWFTPIWFRQVIARPFRPRYLYGAIVGPGRDKGRGPARKTLAALEAHCATLERVLAPKLTGDCSSLSEAQWWDWYEELHQFGLAHFRIIRWGVTVHMVVFHGVLQFLLQRWARDSGRDLYFGVVSGLPRTRTAQVNRDLWHLAMIARGDPALKKKLLAGKYPKIPPGKGAGGPLGGPFGEALRGFLAAHGHRGPSRSPVFPRWREAPALVLGLVRAQLHGDAPPPDPAAREAESTARRRGLEHTALGRVGRGWLGWLRRPLLAFVMAQAQKFTVFREDQRYHQDYLMFQVRQLGLDMGRRLREGGWVDDPMDGLFLFIGELRTMRADPAVARTFRALVRERRAHYERWKNRVPATYLFDGVETEGDLVEGDPPAQRPEVDGTAFLGVSRGRYRGPARLVLEMEHLDDLEPGDILVTENIDPAWTTIFPMLGGLVTETGGVLAHGALLAREYGIPAVMNVPHATATFVTGQHIEIDGTTGTVRTVENP